MKTLVYMAAAAAMLSLAACSGKQAAEAANQGEATDTVVTETYVGVLPAADADGVQYSVVLNYTGDTEGQYEMVQSYLMADSVSESFETSGDFTVNANDSIKYITLAAQDSTQNVYFVVASDSTITLVDATLTPSANPELNYTLTAQ